MKRIDIIREIARCNGLIVCNLGYPGRELFSVCDRSDTFYMMGSMGLAGSIGLGLSLSQEKRTYVIEGDGALLMNPGSLVTIAHHAPENFCLVVIDNCAYGSTGNQQTYTAGKTDLAALARAAGNDVVTRVSTTAELRNTIECYSDTKAIIIADAEPGNEPVGTITLKAVEIAQRFMKAVHAKE